MHISQICTSNYLLWVSQITPISSCHDLFDIVDGSELGVTIRVHRAGSCRVGWYISAIWVNPNMTRLLIVSGYVNPNTTRLLNGLTRHNSHNPFNKQVGLGWHDPTQPIWPELLKMTYTTHFIRITQNDLYNPFDSNYTNWPV